MNMPRRMSDFGASSTRVTDGAFDQLAREIALMKDAERKHGALQNLYQNKQSSLLELLTRHGWTLGSEDLERQTAASARKRVSAYHVLCARLTDDGRLIVHAEVNVVDALRQPHHAQGRVVECLFDKLGWIQGLEQARAWLSTIEREFGKGVSPTEFELSIELDRRARQLRQALFEQGARAGEQMVARLLEHVPHQEALVAARARGVVYAPERDAFVVESPEGWRPYVAINGERTDELAMIYRAAGSYPAEHLAIEAAQAHRDRPMAYFRLSGAWEKVCSGRQWRELAYALYPEEERTKLAGSRGFALHSQLD